MTPGITLKGIDQAISDLNYRNKAALKCRLLSVIRANCEDMGSVESLQGIDTDSLVGLLWGPSKNSSSVRNRKKNLSSIKSAINAELGRLYKDGKNPEGIKIGPEYTFVMSDEAKDQVLSSFMVRGEDGSPIDLEEIRNVLNVVNDVLSDPRALEEGKGAEGTDKLDDLKDLIQGLSQKIGLDEPGPIGAVAGTPEKESGENLPSEPAGGMSEVVEAGDREAKIPGDSEGEEGEEGLGENETLDESDELQGIFEGIEGDETDEIPKGIEPEENGEFPDDGMVSEEIENEEETDDILEDIEGDDVEDILDEMELGEDDEDDLRDLEEIIPDQRKISGTLEGFDEVDETELDKALEEIGPGEDGEGLRAGGGYEKDETQDGGPGGTETSIVSSGSSFGGEDRIDSTGVSPEGEEVPERLENPEGAEEVDEVEEVLGGIDEAELDEIIEEMESGEGGPGVGDGGASEGRDVPGEGQGEAETGKGSSELSSGGEGDNDFKGIVDDVGEHLENTDKLDEAEEVADVDEVLEEIDEEDLDEALEEIEVEEDAGGAGEGEEGEETGVKGSGAHLDEDKGGVERGIESEETEGRQGPVALEPAAQGEEAGPEKLEEGDDIDEVLEEIEEDELDDDLEEIESEEDHESVALEAGLREDGSDDAEGETESDQPFEPDDIENENVEELLESLDEVEPDDVIEEPDDKEDLEEIDESEIEELDIAEDIEEAEVDEDSEGLNLDKGHEELGDFGIGDRPEHLNDVLDGEISDADTGEGDEESKREILAERFDRSLGAMDRYYNQHILIPEGEYRVGSKQPGKDRIQERAVRLSRFFMGKFPVTNALFEIFVEKTGYRTRAEKLGHGTVYYGRCRKIIDETTGQEKLIWNSVLTCKTVKGACWYQPLGSGDNLHNKRNHPVVQVCREDAMAFASWTGKRLPTEAEWEAASRGSEGKPFPWGDDWVDQSCNIEESNIGDTTPVNKYQDLESTFGIVDLIGNVWEWTMDDGGTEHAPDKNSKYYVAKGGSWISENRLCLFERSLLAPESHSNILGFRCVAY